MDNGSVAGWVLEARIHFGHQLTQYVGVSVFVKQCSLSLLARTSSLLLCVGVGSYLAYRLCLKLFGCHNLSSLLARLKSDCLWTADDEEDVNNKVYDKLKPFQINDAWSSSNSVDDFSNDSVSKEKNDDQEECTVSTRLTDVSGNENCLYTCDYHKYWNSSEVDNNEEESSNCDWNNDDELYKTKRTTALSDDGNVEASTSSGSADSPPPIRRLRNSDKNVKRPTSVPYRDDVTSRCSSQAFAWDPVFTPYSMDEGEFRAFDDALRNNNNNMDGFYNPASLIERFLASLDGEASVQEDHLDRHFLSPGPSEVSEFSVAVDRELGDQTVDNMERLQGEMRQLKRDVKNFYDDFGKYFDERKQWITGIDYSKEVYRSVVVGPSSSSDTASVKSCSKSSPPLARSSSRKRLKTYSLRLPEKRPKKSSSSSDKRESGFGIGAASFYDSYHTQISADMHASQSSDVCCADGKHCGVGDNTKPKMALTSSSFVDSCISIDFRSVSSGSSENIVTNVGVQHFVPSLGVTPEDRDAEGMSTSGSLRPSSLEWDEMDTTNDENNEFSRRFSSSDDDVDVMINNNPAIDLSHYISARFHGNEKCLKVARRLAKRRNLCYTRLIDKGPDSLIRACLDEARINRLPIFKCATYQTVKDAADVCFKRCSYVSQFVGTPSSNSASRNEELMDSLELLWQFHNNSVSPLESRKQISLVSGSDEAASKLVQGVKVLMMLRVVEVYEQISFTRQPPRQFYNDLFRNQTPRCIAKQLGQCATARCLNELETSLLADTLGIILELYKFDDLSNPSNVTIYPLDQNLTNVGAVPSVNNCNRVAVGQFGSENFMPLL